MKIPIDYEKCFLIHRENTGCGYVLGLEARERFELSLFSIDSLTEDNMPKLFLCGVSLDNSMFAHNLDIYDFFSDEHTKPIMDKYVERAKRLLSRRDSTDFWKQIDAAFDTNHSENYELDSEEYTAYQIALDMERANSELRTALIGLAFEKISQEEAEVIQAVMNRVPFSIIFPGGDEKYDHWEFARTWKKHHPGKWLKNEPDAF